MVALRVLAVAVISTLTTPGHGAGVQTKEAAVGTAGLHRAILQGPTAAAYRLIKAGVAQSLGPGKQTALHLAAYKGHAGLVAAILKHDANVNAQHTADSEAHAPQSQSHLHLPDHCSTTRRSLPSFLQPHMPHMPVLTPILTSWMPG